MFGLKLEQLRAQVAAALPAQVSHPSFVVCILSLIFFFSDFSHFYQKYFFGVKNKLTT